MLSHFQGVALFKAASEAGPHEQHLRRSLQRPFAAQCMVVAALISSGAVIGDTPTARCTSVLLSMCCAAIACTVYLSGVGLAPTAGLAIASLLVPMTPDPTGSEIHLAGVMTFAVTSIAIALLFARKTALIVGLLYLPTAIVSAVIWLGMSPMTLDNIVILMSVLAAATGFLHVLVGGARESDDLARQTDEADAQELLGASAESAAGSARSVIHNSVVAALDSVTLGVGTKHIISRSKEALAALDLERSLVDSDITSFIAKLKSLTQIRVVATGTHDQQWNELPPDVRSAFFEATAEACRNAEQHSLVSKVMVEFSTHAGVFAVRIIDAGVGMGDAVRGFGVITAMAETMRRVNGSMTITDRDPGTEVSLGWSKHTGRSDRQARVSSLEQTWALTAGRSGRARVFGAVAWPLLFAQTYLAARYSLGQPSQAALLALAAVLIALVVVLTQILGRRALLAAEVWGVSLLSAGLIFLGFQIAGTNSGEDYTSWFVGFVSVGLTLATFAVPIRWLIVVVAPSASATAAAVSWGGSADVLAAAGCLVFPIPLMFGWILGELIRRSHDGAEDQRRELLMSRHQSANRIVETSTRELHLAYARKVVRPWLEAIATSAIDTSTPQVQARSRLFALACEDELVIPGAIDDALRGRIDAFRSAGGSVVLHHPGDRAYDPRLTLRLLDRVLDTVASHGTVTIAFADGAGHGRISVQPPPQDLHQITSALRHVDHEAVDYTNAWRIRFRTDGVAVPTKVMAAE